MVDTQDIPQVQLTNIIVSESPANFLDPFQIELTVMCFEKLQEKLEWKVVYVGSSDSNEHDQVLATVPFGPVWKGRQIIVFEVPAPDITKLPQNQIVKKTVLLVGGFYCNQEFVRVGVYVNNEYNEEKLALNPPNQAAYDKIMRTISDERPKYVYFKIVWDSNFNINASPSGDANIRLRNTEAILLNAVSEIDNKPDMEENVKVDHNLDVENKTKDEITPDFLHEQLEEIVENAVRESAKAASEINEANVEEPNLNLAQPPQRSIYLLLSKIYPVFVVIVFISFIYFVYSIMTYL